MKRILFALGLLLAARVFGAAPIPGEYAGTLSVYFQDTTTIGNSNAERVKVYIEEGGAFTAVSLPRFNGTLFLDRDKFTGTIDEMGNFSISDGSLAPNGSVRTFYGGGHVRGGDIVISFNVAREDAAVQDFTLRIHFVRRFPK